MENKIKLPQLSPEQLKAIISNYHREGGKKGGATMKKRGTEYFKEIGRQGAEARWKKKRAADEAKGLPDLQIPKKEEYGTN